MTSPSNDPLFGNHASDLLRAAAAAQPTTTSGEWQPPTPEVLQAQLPGYQVLEFIARGGMGAVYRGVQVSLNRLVAIKILPPQLLAADPSFAGRFKQEAQAMAQFSHPGIVAVFDFGEMADGTLFFVMEFIDGTDVARMIQQQGRLSSAHAMAITAHVCDALQCAHEHGVVHRDIKPANIMVGYDGRVKVADFGLAKSVQSANTSLTVTGHVMGTPHYVAPEALVYGMSIDHRADIYAVGVMLYQMLTGKLPQGLFEMPSFKVPGLDPRYDHIIASAMRENRDQRYQRMKDMRRALDAILTQPVQQSQQATQSAPPAVISKAPSQGRRAPPANQVQPPQREPEAPRRFAAKPPPKTKSSAVRWLVGVMTLAALAGGFVWMRQAKSKASGFASVTKGMPHVNSLGMKFVPVPGTQVLFGIWDTRVRDYAAYATTNAGVDASWKAQEKDGVPVGREPDHPAVNVSWEDAQAFCRWLTEKEHAEGTLPRGARYRLPTDAEWSTAVGMTPEAGSSPVEKNSKNSVEYPHGTDFPPRNPNVANYADAAFHTRFPAEKWFVEGYSDGFATTSPVGSFPANGFGLYDMGGNVWQWMQDPFRPNEKPENHVVRGGSWSDGLPNMLFSSVRSSIGPEARDSTIGFRCVIEQRATPDRDPLTAASKSQPASAANDFIIPHAVFAGASIGDALEFFTAKTRDLDPAKKGVTFIATAEVRALPTKITFDLFNVKLSDVANYVAMMARLKITPDGDAFILEPSSDARPPFAARLPTARSERHAAIVFPSVFFQNATLAEAAEFYHIKCKDLDPQREYAHIIIDPALDAQHPAVVLDLKEVTLAEAMRRTCQSVSAEAICIGDAFYWQPAKAKANAIPVSGTGVSSSPVPSAASADVEVKLEFMNADKFFDVGGYQPVGVPLGKSVPKSITKAPSDLVSPLYGEIFMGPSDDERTYAVIADNPVAPGTRLLVDSNANGDLTDDPPAKWQPSPQSNASTDANRSVFQGEFLLELKMADGTHPARIEAFRNRNSQGQDSLWFHPQYGRVGRVTIAGKRFNAFLYDDEGKGDFSHPSCTFRLDLDGDLAYRSEQGEVFPVSKPFSIDGVAYELSGLTPDGAAFRIVRSGVPAGQSSSTASKTGPAKNNVIAPPATPAQSGSPSPSTQEYRNFTDHKGRTIRAALVSIRGDDITLQRDDGHEFAIKAATLSLTDIEYLKTKGLTAPKTSAVVQAPTTAATPFSSPSRNLVIPEESKSSTLQQTTIFGLSRTDASGILADARLKSNPEAVLEGVQGMVASKRAMIVSNLSVSAKSGTRSRVEGAYGCESEITIGSDGGLKGMFAITSIRSPGTPKLTDLNVTAKRGDTRFLGSFDDDGADPKVPVRFVFVTFH